MYGGQPSLLPSISLEVEKDDINIRILSFLCATFVCECVKRRMETILGVV